MIKMMATGCALFATSGCSSIMNHTGPDQGYYPGTRTSVEMLKDDGTGWAMKPLVALDLPLSAVMDTLLLPYDYLRADSDKSNDSPRERIIREEQKNLAATGNPGQGDPLTH
jgi:uncharacterized protein YceK